MTLLHRHIWKDTRLNPWCIATEQRCRCGEYRHHEFSDLSGMDQEPNWQEGRHPKSVATDDHEVCTPSKILIIIAAIVWALLAVAWTCTCFWAFKDGTWG